jgi:16S rRNA (cytidine1402-2'-O)-methyltransferase
MMQRTGTVYMIPLPIADNTLHGIPQEVFAHITRLQYYFVENTRTARRFIRSLHPTLDLTALQFSEIDKHAGPDFALFKSWLLAGHEVGIMSEAGCPGIADPGSELVRIAQEMNVHVVPLTGPNSLMLALMASGLNGQSFAFNGYLPVKEPMRSKRIKDLEALSAKQQQTQIVIETPYRNQSLLTDMIKNCHPRTRLCIALNLTDADGWVRTRTIAQWGAELPTIGKAPAVFLFLA